VDRLLHVRVEVLHAEAQPVEAHPGQPFEPGGVDSPRIDLDRLLPLRRERELPPEHRQQPPQALVVKEGRRSASQVQLADHRPPAQFGDLQRHFALQVVEVFDRPMLVAGNDLVASAVIAERFAERQVDVERQRAPVHPGGGPLVDGLDIVVRSEGIHESICRRVRGITRTGDVEPPQHGGRRQLLGMRSGREYGGSVHRRRSEAVSGSLCRRDGLQSLTWINTRPRDGFQNRPILDVHQ